MPIDASSEYVSKKVNAPMSKTPATGRRLGAQRKVSLSAGKAKPAKKTADQSKSKATPRRDKVATVPRFVRHNPLALQVDNLLLQRVENIFLPIEQHSHAISFVSPIAYQQFKPCLSFDLNIDGVMCSLELDRLASSTLFSDLLSIESLNDLPNELLIAVSEAAFDNVLKYFEQLVNKSISVEAVNFGKSSEKSHTSKRRFALADNAGAGKGVACLCGAEEMDALLAESLKRMSILPTATEFLGNVQVKMHVELGSVLLSNNEAGALSSGDILIVDSYHLDEPADVSIHIEPNMVVQGTLNENRVVITKVPEAEMENIAIHDEMSAEPAHLEDLQIKLLFEVGDKTLPIKELKSIKPGYTFELDSKMDTPVRIRANGHVMGVGQLVRVGDRVGVRILELLNGVTG